MGNDSSHTIKISGGHEEIDAVLRFVDDKTRRWEQWDARTKKWSAPKKAADRERQISKSGGRAGFVTWGFVVEDRLDEGERSTGTLDSWVNENSSNCHVSGEEGELADLYGRFPDLECDVEYSDDYSQGFCMPPNFEKRESEDED